MPFLLEKLQTPQQGVTQPGITQESTQVTDATPVETTYFALTGEIVLGRPLKTGARGKSDILCPNDSAISKEHAILQLDPALVPGQQPQAFLKDISRFGSFLQGRKVDPATPAALKSDDVFKLGQRTYFRLRYKPMLLLSATQPDKELKELASTLGAIIVKEWSPQVTHVIQESEQELTPATVAAALTGIPVVTRVWLTAVGCHKVQAAQDLPSPAHFHPSSLLLPLMPTTAEQDAALPFSSLLALKAAPHLLQGLKFAFAEGFEDTSLRACTSLLGGTPIAEPVQGSLVVAPTTKSLALPKGAAAVSMAELLTCFTFRDRGALDRRLEAAHSRPPHKVLLPPPQSQQQEVEDRDITEPGTDEMEEHRSVNCVQGGGAGAQPSPSRATNSAANLTKKTLSPGAMKQHSCTTPDAAAGAVHKARGKGGTPVLLPPKQHAPASVSHTVSPPGSVTLHRRQAAAVAGPEIASSKAGFCANTPAAAEMLVPQSKEGGPLKRKHQELEDGADDASMLQDGEEPQPAPSTAYKAKRTRKTQQPGSSQVCEIDGKGNRLDSVFGEAPAAKPLNIAGMFRQRELTAGVAEQPAKTTRQQGAEAHAAAATLGPQDQGPANIQQQRQLLQQKKARKAKTQVEADKVFDGPSGTMQGAASTQHQPEASAAAGTETCQGLMPPPPPTCIRAPLVVKSVDWEGGSHEANAEDAGYAGGPNFKHFRKAGVEGCMPAVAMQRPIFTLVHVDAFKPTAASNAFLKGEQAKRAAMRQAEELFVSNPKLKKNVRGRL